jgi:Class III cytochrome C family
MQGRRIVSAWLLLLLASGVSAQSLETAVMPGQVVQGHAKLESECRNCHVRFNRAAQTGLCIDCHKDVSRDASQRRGFHGRVQEKECRACHTDHKGRNADIAPIKAGTFDHRQTDFVLKGAHASAKLECRACHVPSKKYREAPSVCNACHKKDDKHKGKLGTSCANCHTENNWKQTRFDHSKTRFPLRNGHADVACDSCHKSKDFKGAPLACVACHQEDDRKKGHHGKFGKNCASCHTDKSWKTTTFNHDRDTKYPLKGKHAQARCAACHTGILYKETLRTTCISCHQKDDKHKGQLGPKCESCHNEASWRQTRFDHGLTRFPLLGKHAAVKCETCHTTPQYKDAKTDCYSCHRKDDKHKLRLGAQCEDCHNARNWMQWNFDHGKRTSFVLEGKHLGLDCHACHKFPVRGRAVIASTCVSCHEDVDAHRGGFGRLCEACHLTSSFKTLKPGSAGRPFR